MEAILNLLLPGVTKILDKVIPDVDARATAQEEIKKLLLENKGKIYDAMAKVMASDSRSTSKYTAMARPTVVYWTLGMITVIAGSSFFGGADAIIHALQGVPDELWTLMQVGIGAYILTRGVERSLEKIHK